MDAHVHIFHEGRMPQILWEVVNTCALKQVETSQYTCALQHIGLKCLHYIYHKCQDVFYSHHVLHYIMKMEVEIGHDLLGYRAIWCNLQKYYGLKVKR